MSPQCPAMSRDWSVYIPQLRFSCLAVPGKLTLRKQITKGPDDCEHHSSAMAEASKTHIACLSVRQARKRSNHEKVTQLSGGHCALSNPERPFLHSGIRSNGKRGFASRRCSRRHAFLQTTLPGAWNIRLLNQKRGR